MKTILLCPDELRTLLNECLDEKLKHFSPASPPEPATEYITRKKTAEILGVSLPTLNDWSKKGILQSYRIASRVRYKKEEVLGSLNKVRTIKNGRD